MFRISAESSASRTVAVSACRTWGLTVRTDGTNAGTATLFNGPTTAGATAVLSLGVPGTALTGALIGLDAFFPTGVFVKVAGTGAKAAVIYENAG